MLNGLNVIRKGLFTLKEHSIGPKNDVLPKSV